MNQVGKKIQAGKTRRTALLEEMGLVPVWRLRRSAAGNDADAAVAAGEARAAPSLQGQVDAREVAIRSMDWDTLRQAVSGCTACELHRTRTQAVLGVGDQRAGWLLVGEAPGAEEDRLGEPFVGQAGRLLDNMLASLELKRSENVYIANVLKCRPPGNRNPDVAEVACCTPFLRRQIALIGPRLIVAMGRFAAQTLLDSDATIASLRGRVHRYAGVPLIVTYHPAYLLRNLPDKAKAWSDLLFARRTMNSLNEAPG
ncbi:MAG: uracil-DNA glycosylase [Betaproteobacteria bacterium]|nr:uracil-DNA glycosylase [Betaproteobacteria bacterium]